MNRQGKTRIPFEERPVEEHGMGAQSVVPGLRHHVLLCGRSASRMLLGGRPNRLCRMPAQIESVTPSTLDLAALRLFDGEWRVAGA